MRNRFLHVLYIGLLVVAIVPGAGGGSIHAQQRTASASYVTLQSALEELGKNHGVRIVFAEQMVAGKYASCSWRSLPVSSALSCLLRETGLVARQVQTGQWVVGPQSRRPSQASPVEADRKPNPVISGRVTDVETGLPLVGAHVILQSDRRGTVASADGRFRMEAKSGEEQDLEVSFLGYRTDVFVFQPGVYRDIALSPVAIESNEVLVEDRKSELTETRVTPGAVTLDEYDWNERPVYQGQEDLFQVLQNVSSVSRSAETNGELVIRGSEDGQNLYLLDGVPVYHPTRTFGQFSSFQTDLIQDLRLYRGSMPAEFGGRLSSVLDATLKDGFRDRPSVTAGINSRNVKLMVEAPIGKYLSGMLAVRGSHTSNEDLYVVAGDEIIQTLDGQYRFRDLTGKVTFRPGVGHQISATLYRGGDSLGTATNALLFPTLRENESFSGNRIQSRIGQKWQNERYSLQYRYVHGSDLFINALAYQTGYTIGEINGAYADINAGLLTTYDNRIEGDYAVRLRDRGVKVEMNHYSSSRFQSRAGLNIVYHQFDSALEKRSTIDSDSDSELENIASVTAVESVIYLENSWQPFDRLEIQPGVRIGSFETSRYITPRLQARYQAHPRVALKAGISTQVQHIHWLRDRYALVFEPDLGVWQSSGTMHTRPARGLQVAGGLESRPFHWLEIGADLYWRRYTNVLLAENPYRLRDGLDDPWIEADLNPQRYMPGNSRAYGVEISTKALFRSWQSVLSYSLSRSLYQRPQLSSFQPARFDAPHAFRGAVYRRAAGWTFGLIGELRSGYPTQSRYVYEQQAAAKEDGFKLSGNEFVAYFPTTPAERLPFYARLDASLGYRFNLLGLSWNAEMQFFNLTDRTNYVDQVYLIDQANPNPFEGQGFQSMFNLKVVW